MAFCLVCLSSAVLLLASISSGVTSSVNMCRNRTRQIYDDTVDLVAISPLTTNTSMTCSCSVYITSSSNEVNVEFSREYSGPESFCKNNAFDEVTLNYTQKTNARSYSPQDDELSSYQATYVDISALSFDITIYSICGSNYTIQLKEISSWGIARFSYVTCSNPKIVKTSTLAATSPTTSKSTAATSPTKSKSTTATSPTTSKSTAATTTGHTPTVTDIAENDRPVVGEDKSASSQTGLIVGVVVGVSVGLLLLGAIILSVFIFRRRRAKHQPLTNANDHTAPTENPYEPEVSSAPVSYEEIRTQLQPGTLYDNQTAAVEPLTTETNQNYYNVRDIDDGEIPTSYAASNGEVDNFAQEAQSIKDTDTTVIENELYGK